MKGPSALPEFKVRLDNHPTCYDIAVWLLMALINQVDQLMQWGAKQLLAVCHIVVGSRQHGDSCTVCS
jgi:hypothetical protein